MLDKQETFETVARHLFNQGKAATENRSEEEFNCRYRTDNGLKCAIGCLITDEEYLVDMEGESVHFLNNVGILPARFDYHYNSFFLGELQKCHDEEMHWVDDDTMKTALKDIAAIFNLNTAFLSELKFPDR